MITASLSDVRTKPTTTDIMIADLCAGVWMHATDRGGSIRDGLA